LKKREKSADAVLHVRRRNAEVCEGGADLGMVGRGKTLSNLWKRTRRRVEVRSPHLEVGDRLDP